MLIDANRKESLDQLQKDLGYRFKDVNLLNLSLVHTSYTNEHSNLKGKSNERLEFLGDAVLELVFTEILYKTFKIKDEGYLTKLRANLVCEESFSEFSNKYNLSKYILLGKGEEKSGGREKDSIKADAFEALHGALYLDSGYELVYTFIYEIVKDKIEKLKEDNNTVNDYKTRLQEHLHKYKNINYHYELVKEEGPSHAKVFYINLYKNKELIGEGVGKNKKEAEQMAAKSALEYFKIL